MQYNAAYIICLNATCKINHGSAQIILYQPTFIIYSNQYLSAEEGSIAGIILSQPFDTKWSNFDDLGRQMGERLLASAESKCSYCAGASEKLLPKTPDDLRGGQDICKNGTFTRASGSANDSHHVVRNKLEGASAETGYVCRAVKDLNSQPSRESKHLGTCSPSSGGSLRSGDCEDEYRRLSLSGRIAIDGVQKRAFADSKMPGPVQVNHDNGEEKARNSQRASWGQLRQSAQAGAGFKMSTGESDKTSRGVARRSWCKDPGAEKTASRGPQKRVTGQLNDDDVTRGNVEAQGNHQDEKEKVEFIVSNGIATRPNSRILQKQGISGKSIRTTSKANGTKAPATGGNYGGNMDKLAASLCFVTTSDTPSGQHANPHPQSFAVRPLSDLDQVSTELKPVEPWQNSSVFPSPEVSQSRSFEIPRQEILKEACKIKNISGTGDISSVQCTLPVQDQQAPYSVLHAAAPLQQ
jgi:hypothetical protein